MPEIKTYDCPLWKNVDDSFSFLHTLLKQEKYDWDVSIPDLQKFLAEYIGAITEVLYAIYANNTSKYPKIFRSANKFQTVSTTKKMTKTRFRKILLKKIDLYWFKTDNINKAELENFVRTKNELIGWLEQKFQKLLEYAIPAGAKGMLNGNRKPGDNMLFLPVIFSPYEFGRLINKGEVGQVF